MQLTKIHIIKVCITMFLIIFVLIYLIEKNHKKEIILISKIDQKYIEKNIKIQGKIVKQTINKNTLFFTLKDNSSQINIIAFKTNKTLEKNKVFIIEGKVTTYDKKLEIIANKIEKLNE